MTLSHYGKTKTAPKECLTWETFMHAFDWLVIAGYLALFLGVAWSVIAKNKDTADDSRQTFARHAAYAGLAVATLLLAVWIGLGRFVLKKLLTGLAMPCGLVWLGIGMAFYLALLQRSKGLSWLLGVVLIGYTVAGNALVGQWLMGTLEEQFYSIDAFAGEPFETVVVLGGCTEQLANGQVQLGSSGDRVALGSAALLQWPGETTGRDRGKVYCRWSGSSWRCQGHGSHLARLGHSAVGHRHRGRPRYKRGAAKRKGFAGRKVRNSGGSIDVRVASSPSSAFGTPRRSKRRTYPG